MPNTFRVGQRVTHRDNDLMRGFVKSLQVSNVGIMWDGDTDVRFYLPGVLLPVEFGMGTTVENGVDERRVLTDTGDLRIVSSSKISPLVAVTTVADLKRIGWREAGAEPAEEWPRKKDTYFLITFDGVGVEHDYWEGGVSDYERKACGNCFRTESEAQAAAERVKAALKGV